MNNLRSLLYLVAKGLGDTQAIQRAFSSGSFLPVFRRILRRIYGKIASRGFIFFK